MPTLVSCCHSLASLSRGFAKATAARLRALGVARRADPGTVAARLRVCSACPLAVVYRGATYCGPPLLRKVAREPAIDGCGCPLASKAADPGEHCPVDAGLPPARPGRKGDVALSSAARTETTRPRAADRGAGCSCKWCAAGG